MQPDAAAEPDPSWPQYPCTVLEIHARGQANGEAAAPIVIDLRTPIDAQLARRLRQLGLGGRWAVVTAFNPRGRVHDPAVNMVRCAELEQAVREAGAAFAQADGRSPDASHREVGLAVALSQPAAVALAARFGQSAIFWFDGEAFWLVPTGAAGAPERLPVVSESDDDG